MRVVVDGSFLGAHRGGDETFLLAALAGLAAGAAQEDRFPVLLGAGRPVPPLPGPTAWGERFPVHRVAVRPGAWHFSVTLPAAVRRLAADGPVDAVFSMTHTAVRSSAPAVFFVGDLSFLHRPGDYPRATAARLRALVPRQAAAAAAVVVPSEATRTDLLALPGTDPDRVHVVPIAVLPPARPVATTTDLVGGPYLLYLGNLHPRKNVPALVEAFRRARAARPELRDHRLVVAGGTWFGSTAESEAAAGDDAVVLLGRVDDDQRAALLHGASALAYPSLFEGFGLPPLEAMSVGVPVLASRRTSIPEVCGGAALLVDPENPEELTDGVVRILTDHGLRAHLRRAGPARSATFDLARTGEAMLAALAAATSGSVLRARPDTRTQEGTAA